jgi:hypothetical protein
MKRVYLVVICLAGLWTVPVPAGDPKKSNEVKLPPKPARAEDTLIRVKPVQQWKGQAVAGVWNPDASGAARGSVEEVAEQRKSAPR